MNIWIRSRKCTCLVTWFCYHLIAEPGDKTGPPSWPDPYTTKHSFKGFGDDQVIMLMVTWAWLHGNQHVLGNFNCGTFFANLGQNHINWCFGLTMSAYIPGFCWFMAMNRSFKILRPRRNGFHFTDNIFKCIFLNENIQFQLRFYWSLFSMVQ